MNAQLQQKLKTMSQERIQAKLALELKNREDFRKEIEQEEDVFWSQSIDKMEAQMSSARQLIAHMSRTPEKQQRTQQ